MKKYLFAIFAALLLIAAGTAIYFYKRVQELNSGKQNTQAEVKALVAKVGQLIVLPQGEDPTVATVVDSERLKDQPFFANAKIGDKVLIYANARKAILYNPESNKIIEVAPVSIGNPPLVTTPATTTPATTTPATTTSTTTTSTTKKR